MEVWLNRQWWLVLWLSQLVLLIPPVTYFAWQTYWGPGLDRRETIAALFTFAYATFVVAAGRRGMLWLQAHRKQLLLSVVALVLSYGLCEWVLTGLSVMGFQIGGRSIWVFEESHKTLHFDPIRGCRLAALGSRVARVTNGSPEFVGEYRGNNEGFPDRDDFSVKKSEPRRKRFATMGDSFTSAQFLGTKNWPDYVEDATRESKEPLELFNFSCDGGGLANWWSVLTRIVEREGYEFDGVVFAIYGDDLQRGFSITEHRGYYRHMFARIPCWDPASFPQTLEQAKPYLRPLEGYIVSQREFEAALVGDWTPRRDDSFRLFIASRVWQAIQHWRANSEARLAQTRSTFAGDHRAMILDIRRSLDSMHVPAMVVSIPNRAVLLSQGEHAQAPADAREFAKLIGARLVNGALAFRGLTAAEIRADWLPYDGHWAQAGSDRFGSFMADVLTKWPSDEK